MSAPFFQKMVWSRPNWMNSFLSRNSSNAGYDTVLDGDGEIVRTAPHMDVRRIVVEGVDVNQDALNDEYRTHLLRCLLFLGRKGTKKT